ncbi:MAG: hypothetical protein Q9170_001427 [Blastenia crenularia]
MDFSSFPAPHGYPPLQHLVRPEQIPRLANIQEEQKATYIRGVTTLWEQIKTKPPESNEYQLAYKKLHEASETLKKRMNQVRAAQNGPRPASQGQPTVDVRPAVQPPGQVPPGQAPEQFSRAVLDNVQKFNFVAPREIVAQGHERQQMWLRNSRQQYAKFLQTYETSQIKLRELNVLQQNKEGKTITAQDAQHLNNYRNQYTETGQRAKEWLTKFNAQQESIKKQAGSVGAAGADATRGQAPVVPAAERPASVLEPQASHTSTATNTMSDHQGQPHTVSSALDAARNHSNSASRPEPIVGNGGQANQGPVNSSSSTKAPEGQAAAEHSQSHQNMNTASSAPPQYHSPQISNPATNTSHGPHPLTHQAAITQSAQKYSQHNYQSPASQSASHAHPQMSGREPQNNNLKMPIPKDLKVPQPQPVTMGPARPTFTGGASNGAMGPMGQPAIQKTPGFVLEDGDRVLGRKKLEELVRQVTGGVDGEEGETLTAAAEEVRFCSESIILFRQTLLDVADDFVDQVVTAACKLAKLRSSQTLELRDIQLVLERNYNIRIPGYASDELRTVKKVQPTPGWTQKLAAVQAAKVTGGKENI